MPFPSVGEKETEEAMNNPRVGDRFTEMYSFWMYVVGREGNIITYMEAYPPCELPKDGHVGKLPLSRFKHKYAYNTIPGYSIRLVDRDNNVDGWEKKAKHHIVEEEYCPHCGRKLSSKYPRSWDREE